MNEDLSDVRKLLKLFQVRIRYMEVGLGEKIRPEHLTSASHIFEGFNRVTARSQGSAIVESTNEKFTIHTFTYSLGIRAVLENVERENSADESLYDQEKGAALEITADFDVEYHSESDIEDSKLKEFSKDHVGYHVWPYWREFVSSSLARLGLASNLIQLPMYIGPESPKE